MSVTPDKVDFENPTAPENYIQKGPLTFPRYWRDEETGELTRAIVAVMNRLASDDQLKTMAAYLEHYIHAPCWLEQREHSTPEYKNKIEMLRETSKNLKTIDHIDGWLLVALKNGIDPL